MALAPKLYPAGLADRNSNSAYEKLKFVEEHYEELMQAYQVIMEHLKIVNESNQVELPDDLVTYDSDNNVLKSGENTIQISADVPDNIVTYVPDSQDTYSAEVPNWNQITTLPYHTNHDGCSIISCDQLYHLPAGIMYFTTEYANYNEYHLVCSDDKVLFNVDELITTANIENTMSDYLLNNNYATSSDIPDMSGYVETSDVANEAGKIPRYNSQGHLVLPDGTEIWCEDNE